jgi:hydrogenase maturation protease
VLYPCSWKRGEQSIENCIKDIFLFLLLFELIMAVKLFFIGNSLAGDDGIGPYLYEELKNNLDLKKYKMFNLGVLGLDIIEFLEEEDTLILVDATYTKDPDCVGNVILIKESELNINVSLPYCHDFGIEQTAKIIRSYLPYLKPINIIGIKVTKAKAFSDGLSIELKKNISKIKDNVLKEINLLIE